MAWKRTVTGVEMVGVNIVATVQLRRDDGYTETTAVAGDDLTEASMENVLKKIARNRDERDATLAQAPAKLSAIQSLIGVEKAIPGV